MGLFDEAMTNAGMPNADKKETKTAGNPTLAKLEAAANAELAAMTEAGRLAELGSKSGALVFKHMLGNPCVADKRRVGTQKDASGKTLLDANNKPVTIDQDCSKPIGFVFKATEDVSVPVITGKKTPKTGFNPEDLSEKTYPAGSDVILTYLELFLLAIRPEYSLRFGAEIVDEAGNKVLNPKGFRLDIKMSTYLKKDGGDGAALPSPSPSLVKGAVKEGMVDICTKGANGEPVWGDNNPYKEKFEVFFSRSTKSLRDKVGGAKKDDNEASYKLAAMCRNILSDMQSRAQ